MQLSQSVKLKQKQSLVMTPQLQQAIKLLQLSNLELTQHLQEQVDENPFLELHEPKNSENSSETTKDSSEGVQADAATTEHHVELSSMSESAALAEDPTAHSDFDNRFDTSIVDAPRTSSRRRHLMAILMPSAMCRHKMDFIQTFSNNSI